MVNKHILVYDIISQYGHGRIHNYTYFFNMNARQTARILAGQELHYKTGTLENC